MLDQLIATFLPYILAAGAFLAAVFYRDRAKRANNKVKQVERQMKTKDRIRELGDEASELDDTSLAERITRR